ncbi:MAG: 2Fe-2S iron-sulfur cluster-binding protein [Haloarculaceae archaeon]
MSKTSDGSANAKTIEVNGQTVQAQDGDTILEAAERAGIDVPTLCQYEGLTDVGACRMCLVEVDGDRLETACTTGVQEDMSVEVDTDELWDHRETLLELMFSEENHYCMYCEMEGDCELEDLFNEAGLDACRFPLEYEDKDVDASNEHVTLDMDRCILCGRCVRTCDEVVGNDTLTFSNRGRETEIVADNDVPLGESTCVTCGACAQACPTGAIYTTYSAYRGRERECETVETTCSECPMGCELEVFTNSGRIVKIEGVEGGPDGGQLCEMGRFELLGDDRERVTQPRVDGDVVDLATAVDRADELLSGAETVNALASDRLPSETVDALGEAMAAYDAAVTVPGADRIAREDRAARQVADYHGIVPEQLRATGPETILNADPVVVFDTGIVDSHPVAAAYARRASKNGATLASLDADGNRLERHADLTVTAGASLARLSERLLAEEDESPMASEINRIGTIREALKGGDGVLVLGPGVEDEATLLTAYALAAETDSEVVSLPGAVNRDAEMYADGSQDGADAAFLLAGDDREADLDRYLSVARDADTVVVQAARESLLTKAADVVLPALDWYERAGTLVDAGGRERSVEAVLDSRAPVDSDRDVLAALSDGDGDTADAAEEVKA